jgi:hypothetical protein
MSRFGFLTSLLIGSFLFLANGCGPVATERLEKTAPEAIRGVWVTAEESYADRKLEGREDALLFYSEKNVYQPFSIEGVALEEMPDGTFYDIEHSGAEGGSMVFSVFLRQGDTTMVFRNQPLMVWRKIETRP